MVGRKFVASASFLLLVSGAAFAQTAPAEKARTEDLVKQAVERYTAGMEAAAQARAAAAQDAPGAPSVALTLEDAVTACD